MSDRAWPAPARGLHNPDKAVATCCRCRNEWKSVCLKGFLAGVMRMVRASGLSSSSCRYSGY